MTKPELLQHYFVDGQESMSWLVSEWPGGKPVCLLKLFLSISIHMGSIFAVAIVCERVILVMEPITYINIGALMEKVTEYRIVYRTENFGLGMIVFNIKLYKIYVYLQTTEEGKRATPTWLLSVDIIGVSSADEGRSAG